MKVKKTIERGGLNDGEARSATKIAETFTPRFIVSSSSPVWAVLLGGTERRALDTREPQELVVQVELAFARRSYSARWWSAVAAAGGGQGCRRAAAAAPPRYCGTRPTRACPARPTHPPPARPRACRTVARTHAAFLRFAPKRGNNRTKSLPLVYVMSRNSLTLLRGARALSSIALIMHRVITAADHTATPRLIH